MITANRQNSFLMSIGVFLLRRRGIALLAITYCILILVLTFKGQSHVCSLDYGFSILAVLFLLVALASYDFAKVEDFRSGMEVVLGPSLIARAWTPLDTDHNAPLHSSTFVPLEPSPHEKLRIFTHVLEALEKTSTDKEKMALTQALRTVVHALNIRHDMRYPAIGYYGTIYHPLQIYEGDSFNLRVHLRPTVWPGQAKDQAAPQVVQDDSRIEIHISNDQTDVEGFLEIELLAAGVNVAGSPSQKCPLASPDLNFYWNLNFEKTGAFFICLVCRLITSKGSTELGRLESHIRAVRVDHLTSRQVWVLTSVAGAMSGLLALVEVLRRFLQ